MKAENLPPRPSSHLSEIPAQSLAQGSPDENDGLTGRQEYQFESPGPLLFQGEVSHQRLRPLKNSFRLPVFYCLLPLSRLHLAVGSLFSVNRFNLLSFHYADHGARDGSHPLIWVRNILDQQHLPTDGETWLQCFPRVLGYGFNPVSFWYCHDREGQLRAVLVEITSAFGQHGHYLLYHPGGSPLADNETLGAAKLMPMSRFSSVDGVYRFRFHREANLWQSTVEYADQEGDLLYASLTGQPCAWNNANLRRVCLRQPLLSLTSLARYHWQEFRLWSKGLAAQGKSDQRHTPN